MNASELCKLLRRQPLKKRAGWRMAQKKSVKKLHSEERKEPYNTLNRTDQNNMEQKLGEDGHRNENERKETL